MLGHERPNSIKAFRDPLAMKPDTKMPQTPMSDQDVERILSVGGESEDGDKEIRMSIPFRPGDRVRVKEGHFENFEGDVVSIDEANGHVTVMINIFNRSTPVELTHWQIEAV